MRSPIPPDVRSAILIVCLVPPAIVGLRASNTSASASMGNRALVMQCAAAAASARFREPNSLALDGHGNVYVVDGTANRVIKLSPGSKPWPWPVKSNRKDKAHPWSCRA